MTCLTTDQFVHQPNELVGRECGCEVVVFLGVLSRMTTAVHLGIANLDRSVWENGVMSPKSSRAHLQGTDGLKQSKVLIFDQLAGAQS